MNSVERLSATPIQVKKSGGENVVSLGQQTTGYLHTQPLSETPSPRQEPIHTPSTDMSILMARMELMENRLTIHSTFDGRVVQEAVKESVIGAALGVFQALATILAVRLILLFTLAGGFFLAVTAMQHQTAISVWVLVAYAILVIFPTAAIEYGRKSKSGG